MPDPVQSIATLLDSIGDRADVEGSPEWYLRSYLIDYKRTLLRKASSQEIKFATAALMSFCARSFATEAHLYKRCAEIAAEGEKLAKQLVTKGR